MMQFTPYDVAVIAPPTPFTPIDMEWRETALAVRARIDGLQNTIAAMPQAEVETRHYRVNGLYAREVFMPAGLLVIGKIHAKDHINILSQGDVTILTEAGARRITAPATFEARAGRKTVGYTHTDCTWTTFHANPDNIADNDEMEAVCIAKDYPDAITYLAEQR